MIVPDWAWYPEPSVRGMWPRPHALTAAVCDMKLDELFGRAYHQGGDAMTEDERELLELTYESLERLSGRSQGKQVLAVKGLRSLLDKLLPTPAEDERVLHAAGWREVKDARGIVSGLDLRGDGRLWTEQPEGAPAEDVSLAATHTALSLVRVRALHETGAAG